MPCGHAVDAVICIVEISINSSDRQLGLLNSIQKRVPDPSSTQRNHMEQVSNRCSGSRPPLLIWKPRPLCCEQVAWACCSCKSWKRSLSFLWVAWHLCTNLSLFFSFFLSFFFFRYLGRRSGMILISGSDNTPLYGVKIELIHTYSYVHTRVIPL